MQVKRSFGRALQAERAPARTAAGRAGGPCSMCHNSPRALTSVRPGADDGGVDPWLRDRLAGVEPRRGGVRARRAAPVESRRSRVDAERLLLAIERRARGRRRRRWLWGTSVGVILCVAVLLAVLVVV